MSASGNTKPGAREPGAKGTAIWCSADSTGTADLLLADTILSSCANHARSTRISSREKAAQDKLRRTR